MVGKYALLVFLFLIPFVSAEVEMGESEGGVIIEFPEVSGGGTTNNFYPNNIL